MTLKTKEKILLMRREMQMTQKQLGDAIGVYHQRIWSWERGIYSPTVDDYEKICALYTQKTGNKVPE